MSESSELLTRASAGDETALAVLFEQHRRRLRQMVRLRLDPRLAGRIDPSDVLQDAYLDVARQLRGYDADAMPFFLWLRLVTGQRLARLHRQHLGAAARDAGREVSLHHGPTASSLSLAEHLLGRVASVSQEAVRAELRQQLQDALNEMEPLDREVIALRHFEELTNQETAEVLGLSKSAASNRYVRALARLQKILETIPGFLDRC